MSPFRRVAVCAALFGVATLALTLHIDASAAKAAEATVKGRVTDVTLYRGQALVTRMIPVEGPQGDLTITVGDLPEQIVAGSLFAEGTESVEVRAVRFLTRVVEENPNPEISELDKALEDLNDQIRANRAAQELLTKRSAYLDSLEGGFVQPAIKTDLARGVLDAEAVTAISQFSFDQREKISNALLEKEKELRGLTRELSVKTSRRAELTRSTARVNREALLFVEKKGDGQQTLRLNYLVNGCGWSPSYTFRAGKDRKEVAFEYNALIQQMSGEAWEGVRLTLSTASPTLAAAGPGLGPFNINLVPAGQNAQAAQQDLAAQLKGVLGRQSSALALNQKATNLAENIGSSWSANTAANEFQSLELTHRIEAWTSLQPADLGATEGSSISYPPLPAPVSLASRSDQQMVRILQGNLASTFYHVATPVLTTTIYREAELTNAMPEDLLGGPTTVYLDGRFVGRGEIPTVASGQTFVVGFGIDPQVRAFRSLLSRDDRLQGANRQLKLEYELLVENFKEEPVSLRLFDRLPYYSDETDIRITLGELEEKLSEDALYLRTERPKNILRWDLTIPGKATGEKAKMIEYRYTAEYAGNLSISVVGQPGAAPAQLQQDFEQMQRARQGGGFGGGMGGAAGGRGGAAAH